MNRDELIKTLMGVFVEELDDHRQTWERALLDLETVTDESVRQTHIHALFRIVHSLKGASRAVGLKTFETLCHRLETLLAQVRDGTLSLSPGLLALLFECGDLFGAVHANLQAEGALPPMADVVARIQQVEAGDVIAEAPTSPQPTIKTVSPVDAVSVSAPQHTGAGGVDQTTLRVSVNKLDKLLVNASELTVAVERLETLGEQLVGLQRFAQTWRHEWRSAHAALAMVHQHLQQEDDTSHRGISMQAGRPLSRQVMDVLLETSPRLQHLERQLDRLTHTCQTELHHLQVQIQEHVDDVHSTRLQPFVVACGGLERMVREQARSQGKQVALEIQGGRIELDRAVIDTLRSPLMHLVRNAIDHGIETPDERQRVGKPPRGVVTIATRLRGHTVEVLLSDDGRGVDESRLRYVLSARGHDVPEDREAMLRLLFMPGLSTASEVSAYSGRGVGLDVVQAAMASIFATVQLVSKPGEGTSFVLRVPLTLTNLRALIVHSSRQRFAIATDAVERVLAWRADEVVSTLTPPRLRYQDALLPLLSLDALLNDVQRDDAMLGKQVLVIQTTHGQAGVIIKRVEQERDVVIKSLGPRLQGLRHLSGATQLPSGEVMWILNAQELVRRAHSTTDQRVLVKHTSPDATVTSKSTHGAHLLVVDDSLTTRSMLRAILEEAGYHVTAAADGEAAWQYVQGGSFDMVISDVEMPRMDGLTLTQQIRASERHQDLPVILVTSLDSEAWRQRGLDVGANAYIIKSAFERTRLLSLIESTLL